MSALVQLLGGTWPWYVAGPLIGAMVPALLLIGNRSFGISSNLRHLCAAVVPGRIPFFQYDWRRSGGWNLAFAVGIMLGGFFASHVLHGSTAHVGSSAQTTLASLGVHDFTGLVPRELFNWCALLTWRGFTMLVGGGLLIGFGTAYAGGCTSGHAISGLADLQLPSLVAVAAFFAGGLLGTWVLLPLLLAR